MAPHVTYVPYVLQPSLEPQTPVPVQSSAWILARRLISLLRCDRPAGGRVRPGEQWIVCLWPWSLVAWQQLSVWGSIVEADNEK